MSQRGLSRFEVHTGLRADTPIARVNAFNAGIVAVTGIAANLRPDYFNHLETSPASMIDLAKAMDARFAHSLLRPVMVTICGPNELSESRSQRAIKLSESDNNILMTLTGPGLWQPGDRQTFAKTASELTIAGLQRVSLATEAGISYIADNVYESLYPADSQHTQAC